MPEEPPVSNDGINQSASVSNEEINRSAPISNEEINQRRHPRVSVKMSVRIATIDSETDPATGKPYFRASEETCANVSRGGVFVLTAEPIAPGRRVLLDMDIPDGPSVQAVGRVAWSKLAVAPTGAAPETGVGVEFLGGAPDQLDALESFLTRGRRERATRRTPAPSPPGA